MQEEFLHFIWRTRRFASEGLETTQGETIRVLHPGQPNRHAGPDFLEARVEIGGTTWVGQVEMHLRASDWLRHGHQRDPAYHNVILHVVMEADSPVTRPDGSRIPCLAMRKHIPARLVGRYRKLGEQAGWIACQPQWPDPPGAVVQAWLDRLLVERLEGRIQRVRACLQANRGDWEETFYQQLARSFGARVNTEPFQQLAERTPLRLLRKHRHSLVQLEALLFGQAGMLEPEFEDAHPAALRREYGHLRRKYGLTPLPGLMWKYLRMRPNNFPSLRIAQFARLHFQSCALFSKMLAARGPEEVENMFDIRLGNYWKDHVRFDRPAARRSKRLGRDAVHLIAINTVAPMLFFYGRQHGRPDLEERAIRLLEGLPAEKNRVVRQWRSQGVRLASAADSQGALQWKANYCDVRRCLRCAVGQRILS